METTREVKPDPQVAEFMKQHNILADHTIELMGNYYSHNSAAVTWQQTAEEELVELINLDFWKGGKDQRFLLPRTITPYL